MIHKCHASCYYNFHEKFIYLYPVAANIIPSQFQIFEVIVPQPVRDWRFPSAMSLTKNVRISRLWMFCQEPNKSKFPPLFLFPENSYTNTMLKSVFGVYVLSSSRCQSRIAGHDSAFVAECGRTAQDISIPRFALASESNYKARERRYLGHCGRRTWRV